MSLETLARSECMGFVGGLCLFRASGRCNVLDGKRCSHLARVILPRHPGLRSEYDALPMRGPDDTPEAVAGIRHRAPLAPAPLRPMLTGERRCPECGHALGPRRRYCDACRGRRRLKTYRRSKRRYRAVCVHS